MWIQLAEARKKAFNITKAYLITKLRLVHLKRCLIVIFFDHDEVRKRSHERALQTKSHLIKDTRMVQILEEEIKDGETKQIRSSEPIQTIQNYGRHM